MPRAKSTIKMTSGDGPAEKIKLTFYNPWERLLPSRRPDLERLWQIFQDRGFDVDLMSLQNGWQEYSAERLTDWYPLPVDDVTCFDIIFPMLGAADETD